MREGWRETSVGDVAKVVRGASPRPKGDPRYYGGSIPRLMVADVTRDGRHVTPQIDYLTEEGAKRSRPMPKGTLTIVCSGDVGRPSFLAVDACIHDGFLALEQIDNGVEPEFLFEVIKQLRRRLERSATHGGIYTNLTTEILREFRFSIPPLPEQRKIAAILRTWDEALEKLTALRAGKEQRYKALARKLFDPCHPAFEKRPNSWQEFELGDVFVERSQFGEENDRLLSITMGGGVIDRDDVGRKDTSTADKSKYKLILPGDIGYNTMRMWQGVAGLSELRGIISPAYTVVTSVADHILDRYAAHLFKSRRMVFDFERYSQGLTSDTWQLKFAAFSKIKVFLPPVEDQEKEANLLDTFIAEAAVIGKQINALTQQKRGLMQKLLTGEWRVAV